MVSTIPWGLYPWKKSATNWEEWVNDNGVNSVVWEFFNFSTKKFVLVSKKSRRAKSEVPWLRRNRASEPCPRPTKSRWKDRGTLRPRRKNYAGGVLRLRTRRFSIFSTWFCGPWTGLGRSISPQPKHFGLCPPGFPTNFSRRIFWY